MQYNVKNEYMGNGYGNARKLMLGLLGSFDRCKYMNVWNECGNGGMLGVNVLNLHLLEKEQ